ncbi:isochorismatase domain-containing protein 1-like [Lethenteron reissneri]|uniref:isochorismatase domain-containing protein 1-like n=1 Tax=Lethenteron reissneri TaxID=7753 RepID=UPI002AB77B04|nr:isochorismatase domain-containing protein 1-like [Lethenteron reissneri]
MSSQLSALLCVGDRARVAPLSRGAGLEESRAAFRSAFAGEREQEAALRGDFAVQLYSEQWGSFVDAGPEMSIEAPCRLRAVPLSGGRQASRPLGLLEPHSSAFFCCDMQERFRPAVKFFGEVALVAQRLIGGARELDVPIVVTEQYPRGLGSTVPELNLAGARAVLPKTRFSMLVPEVEALLLGELRAVRSVVLFGVETHVCIQQTALELTARGYEVHVVGDATSSRSQTDRLLALQRLSQAGVIVTTSEAVLLQLVADKDHPSFRTVQALIKTSAPEMGLVPSLG